jgi:hypothetical protein
MRRVIFLIFVAAAAASCGDAGDDAPDMQEPTYTECLPASQVITTMAGLEALGASGCDSAYVLTITGEGITSLEPLRGLRQVGQLEIRGTAVETLEPLRDLQDVTTDVTFDGNAKLSYCEITGWIATIKSRDPNGNFGATIDNPKQNSPCSSVNYP